MSEKEMYFPPISSYPKNSPTAMPMDEQEAWLNQFPQKRVENKPNGGIIRSVADTREIFLRPMSKKDRAAAIAQARREHKQALKNLAKQEALDAKEVAKQLTTWRRESRKKDEPDREMTTELGQKVLDTLRDNGSYAVSDFPLSKQYIRKIITQIRELGYRVGAERHKRLIVRYVLNKQ